MDFYLLLLLSVLTTLAASLIAVGMLILNLKESKAILRELDSRHAPLPHHIVSDRNHAVCKGCGHTVARYKLNDKSEPICANCWRGHDLL